MPFKTSRGVWKVWEAGAKGKAPLGVSKREKDQGPPGTLVLKNMGKFPTVWDGKPEIQKTTKKRGGESNGTKKRAEGKPERRRERKANWWE